jgi:multidrug resistance efflux pump
MADENQVEAREAAEKAQQEPATEGARKPAGGKPPANPVKTWTRIILILCLALLAWYLRADRVTPSTSQARVHALVVPVAPEVSGTITGVFVSNNQVVAKGQELFQIDAERYQFAVQNAEAALQQVYQGQGAAGANVDAARAQLDSARANEDRSRLDTERMRRIRQQDPGAISQRRLESAEASLKVSQGQVVAAEAALQAAIEQLGEPDDKNSAVQQAQAALDGARLNLERATVRAPESGVVTGVQLDTGNFAGAGQPQMTFIATHNIWIQADLKENNLGNISPGDEAGIVFDVLPGEVFAGTVREIGFGVDVDSPPLGKLPTIQNDKNWLRAAQRYPVLIDFELPANGRGKTPIKVGSQATVVVYTGTHPLSNSLARMVMRVRSILTYAY